MKKPVDPRQHMSMPQAYKTVPKRAFVPTPNGHTIAAVIAAY